MSSNAAFFAKAFEALTGFSPMAWQTRLYDRMLVNDIPDALSLPTGLGKTSIIPIWLIALCWQAQNDKITLPRRMAYVVDRRTVVDQATTIVEGIRCKLDEGAASMLTEGSRRMSPAQKSENESLYYLDLLMKGLRRMSPDGAQPLLGLSTLRGELADNAEWRADAARPAITIGTIDMTGSKLIFGGYGDGANRRAMHAGLLGIDTLLVYDEAHLSPAFSAILRSIRDEQRKENADPITLNRPLRVMEMTATTRYGSDDVFALDVSDKTEQIVKTRVSARKPIRLHQAKNKSDAISQIRKTAVSYKDDAVKTLIYITSPDDADKVAKAIKKDLRPKDDARVRLLTGQIRGHERDQLAQSDLMRQFLNADARPDESVYLVCTSAGEVGIDIDADRMICDVSTLDSMIQRLGRVNRRGESADAAVDVVSAGNEKHASEATADLLKRWAEACSTGVIDGSPKNIEALVAELTPDEREAAFSKTPELRIATDIAFDHLSMTGLAQSTERKLVPQYLRGIKEHEPETAIAWRYEARYFNDVTNPRDIERWFRARPIRAADRLTLPTRKAKTALEAMAKRLNKETDELPTDESGQPQRIFATFIDQHDGSCEVVDMQELSGRELDFQTVVLPDNIGGLSSDGTGAFDATTARLPKDDADVSLDVGIAGPDCSEEYLRRYVYVSAEEEGSERINVHLPQGFVERISIPIPNNANDEAPKRLTLYQHREAAALDNPAYATFHQTLTEHHARIKADMQDMTRRLGLDMSPDLQSELTLAAEMHDCGKAALAWQRYARNINSDGAPKQGEVLAKAERYEHWRMLGGYRHEWGSVRIAEQTKAVDEHPERDLILHLIGAHHGRCRPDFPVDGHDKAQMTTADANRSNADAARRFDALQRRFGRWGLAWLEALVKCADVKASIPNEKKPDETER